MRPFGGRENDISSIDQSLSDGHWTYRHTGSFPFIISESGLSLFETAEIVFDGPDFDLTCRILSTNPNR